MQRNRLITLFFIIFLSPGCQAGGQEALREMTFMAGFRPQANLPFVGAYVAQEKGFFAEEGLAVTIEHSAGGGEHLQLLAAGEVQVTTQDAAVLLQRRADPGLPLVSIGLIGQRGQQAFVALADSGINAPADWAGHSVGFKGTPPPDLFALLAANGLTEADVELVNVGFDPRTLTEGLVDVYPVFKSNEPNLIRGWGFDVVQWEAADYGVPTLGLTYVATEALIESDPEMLQGFMNAVLRGIEYAQQNPDEAVQIVLQYAGEDADAAHMRFMLDTELADAISPEGYGWQTEAQWQALADMLQMYESLPGDVDVTAVFTTQFWSSQK
ncbi:ABC transporter substrate-binding protein [Candidatus Leptofilum sp.]|uniref:ABC transporter substrate-binding protein n=1 Tax=Candidatus Leptofilum sp. TaxID=3241576 RepID=UPI003B5A36A7